MTAKKLWKAFPYGCKHGEFIEAMITSVCYGMEPPFGYVYPLEGNNTGNIDYDSRAVEYFYSDKNHYKLERKK